MVDEARREAISQDLYRRRTADVGYSGGSHVGDFDEAEDEDLIGYDAIEPGLPPASSDQQKWWLDNHQLARAQVPVPQARDGQPMALNPNRPSNPFGHGEEQDWISISRSSSRASFSSLSSSPYEKVALPNIMSSSASATTPRKPLPPHDAGNLAAKVGKMNLVAEQGSSNAAPPPPPPRGQGTAGASSGPALTWSQGPGVPVASMQQMQGLPPPLRPTSAASYTSQDTSSRGKPAPPVAKKPSHLATASPASSHANGFGGNGSGPGRSATFPTNGTGAGPALPGRPPAQKQGPVDLLDSLDEGGQDMGGWETLQPSMKG